MMGDYGKVKVEMPSDEQLRARFGGHGMTQGCREVASEILGRVAAAIDLSHGHVRKGALAKELRWLAESMRSRP